MKALIIDLTHGGILISEKLVKLGFQVTAYDIYNTLDKENKDKLENINVRLIDDINEFKADKNHENYIIYPVHCPIKKEDLNFDNCEFLNFHEANSLILDKWNLWRKENNKTFIEITGVKGKTSTIFLIKNILSQNNNILFLSSLGSYYIKNNEEFLFKKNISINPTSLIEIIDWSKQENLDDYDYILSECSLGVSKLNDISVLTNINDNYPIAKNTKTASIAKKQVFNSNNIIIEYETLKKYYHYEFKEFKDKINSFSLKSKDSTVYVEKIDYGVSNTSISLRYLNLKTLNKKYISGFLKLNTFAPGEYNVLNILAAVTVCLTLNIDKETIINEINNYNKIPGRTNKKIIENSTIIEEINPGINVKSIKKSIEMVEKLDNYTVVIGGKYGITCEEINEDELVEYLKNKNDKINIILTDELGESIHNKINQDLEYYKDYNKILKLLIKKDKNILFIYRSNYSDIKKR
ncbi:MAG: coenzyme F430 synthase [Romboutsia sp.]|nr:coenzyme F430 synthase [Romboutsia sp.]